MTARSLGPADRGYLALVILVPTVVLGVGMLGLPRSVTFFIARDPSQEAAVVRVVRAPAAIQAVSLTILQAAILAVVLSGEPPYVKWAGVAILPLLVANLAYTYALAILQGQRRYLAFNVLRNAVLGFNLPGVLLVAAAGWASVVTFVLAVVVASFLSALITLIVAQAPRPPSSSGDVPRRELVRFGLRGYLAWLSPIATFRLDQAAVGLLISPQALGLYVVGLAFTNLPSFIARSIGFIAFPQIASTAPNQRDETRRYVWLSIALSGTAVIALEATVGWLVPFFFGAEFAGAVQLARILLVGAFFESVRQVLTSTSSGRGRPGLGSIAELTSWLVIVPGVAILMPVWGAEGIAVATALASAASLAVLVVLVGRAEPDTRLPENL